MPPCKDEQTSRIWHGCRSTPDWHLAQHELENFALDLSALAEQEQDAERTQVKIRLGLILKLDEDVVPELHPKFADMLGVAPQFNVICGAAKQLPEVQRDKF